MQAVLNDVDRAELTEPLRATLQLLGKYTRDYTTLTVADFHAVRAAGVSDEALHDALDVAYLFNIITRIADALGFYCGADAAFELSATRLLKRGYK